MKDGVPIALGYLAVSFSLGIPAGKAGLSPLQGFLASFLCNASAGEYAGFTMIAALEDEIGRLRGNVFGEYAGVEELEEDTGEYAEIVCPHCGETLSFSAEELSGSRTAECPFCGGRIDV